MLDWVFFFFLRKNARIVIGTKRKIWIWPTGKICYTYPTYKTNFAICTQYNFFWAPYGLGCTSLHPWPMLRADPAYQVSQSWWLPNNDSDLDEATLTLTLVRIKCLKSLQIILNVFSFSRLSQLPLLSEVHEFVYAWYKIISTMITL